MTAGKVDKAAGQAATTMTTHAPSTAAETTSGLLLVGHGTREAAGMEEFLAAARRVARLAGALPVEPCFLEFAAPTIAAGFGRLVERGVDRVTVVPLLLFAAGHAKRDIPEAVARAAADYPWVTVEHVPHLGCHEAIVRLSNARYHEALRGRAAAPADASALVMVGRGNHDASATAEMHAFVARCRAALDARVVRTAFVAMAEPPLAEVLDEVSSLGVQRVVVVPHLLFGGVLVERIAAAVAQHAAQQPSIEWLVASHLGDSDLLARAVLARARPGCGW
jgi:sirohydrochlorin cobaltochelatase